MLGTFIPRDVRLNIPYISFRGMSFIRCSECRSGRSGFLAGFSWVGYFESESALVGCLFSDLVRSRGQSLSFWIDVRAACLYLDEGFFGDR